MVSTVSYTDTNDNEDYDGRPAGVYRVTTPTNANEDYDGRPANDPGESRVTTPTNDMMGDMPMTLE